MDSNSEIRRVRLAMSQAAGHDVRVLIANINQRGATRSAQIIDPGTVAKQCDTQHSPEMGLPTADPVPPHSQH